MIKGNYSLHVAFILLTISNLTQAQPAGDTVIGLKDAVKIAVERYHALQATKYEADATEKNQSIISYVRRPTLDAGYQANLATANNLTGMFYPTGMLPMTGPPSDGNDYHPATGSAASLLMNWQVLTFGQEKARSGVATAQTNSKQLQWKQEIFRHKINVISSYLDLLLAYHQVIIHLHNIERIQANLKQSRVLVITGIKPGVDSALFLSELSKAKVERLKASENFINNQLSFARLIVSDLQPIPKDTNFLHSTPGQSMLEDQNVFNHPFIKYFQSLVTINQRSEALLKKAYLPKLNLWATAFSRGSGFYPSQSIKTFDGLGFQKYNYGAGFQLTFSIFKYAEVQRQLERQEFLTKGSQEILQDQQLELGQQLKLADATFASSTAIATETETQLKQAQYAFNAMQIRYNTGLVNFTDLIQTQYNLLKAELDLKTAFWNGWKSLLLQAAVAGDESIFLNQIK